ncbi:carbohydrate ABC transporter permease [Alicyclobacillus macrosporangiidus]|jgi:ABC-type glycerol-3-phosphate transport system permease component|uniref:Raffinose/stachyose/melibiose transport system permease protein n=1 Tax=Alicyclobacillus macrosporangiidus TaxID=392015 RepID=A0A1I7G9Q7_9BACL|nr:carbohydrate ABC transporter permease [Alicyclobacillus macrosporangiidus]SFU45158.1 raffinose/stachyose/melibiose transport system permease protein [Alicyclobacillus macrosporangiidus]
MQAKRPWIQYVILVIYALIVILPLLNLVFLSFKDLAGIAQHPFGPPATWHWSNYAQAWTDGNLLTYLVNTAIVSVLSVFIILLFSSAAAYVLARFEFRGNQLIYLTFLAGLALPIQMIAIPLFILMKHLNLLDHLLSVVLVYSASGLSFSVFLLVNFIRSVPRDLEEAAFLDGANHWQVYIRVILPLIRPSLTTVGLLNFIHSWNGFFFPLILLSNPEHMTVAVGVLSFIGEYATQWNLLLPALVIVMLPTIIVFVIASRQFIRNMTAGAIKI